MRECGGRFVRLAQAAPRSKRFLDLAFADGESAERQTAQLLNQLDLC
jgi:hypothetical protein